MIQLRGMTWNHARGYDPLVAATEQFKRLHPQVDISWDKRSLQAFGDFPLDQLVDDYDLMVIDHPHVGDASAQGVLLALDKPERQAELDDMARHTIGASHRSYEFVGRQWALAIDAAAQVACHRPDLLAQAPTRWDEVIALAEQGRVLWPLKPVDAMASFFTLCANVGRSAATSPAQLIDPEVGQRVLGAMRAVSRHLPQGCFADSPIDVLEKLSANQHQHAYCPLLFGYTNYSRDGFKPQLIRFADIPALGDKGPVGSMLGGTGIAVSARTRHADLALEFSYWLASGAVQAGLYVQHSGQPGHAAAWNDDEANRLCGDFFRNTRKTMDESWLRPRYPGFLLLADRGGNAVNAFVRGDLDQSGALAELEAAYQDSQVTGAGVSDKGKAA
ncbi:MAG: carbohydrate ABC transporter substrate-binding protein [Burkholderiaceae bacterium]